MNTVTFILSFWHFNLTAALIAVILAAFHFISNGNRFTRKSPVFFTGIFLLIITFFSPLDYLVQNHLFSAHMTQHILVLLIIPPLLLTGTDKKFLEKFVRIKAVDRIGKYLFHPLITWIAGVGSMWILHIPGVAGMMSGSPLMAELMIAGLLVPGLLFIWPVFTPVERYRLEALKSAVYLFMACTGCTVLGILITFAPSGLFTSGMGNMNADLQTLIRIRWGITPDIDQQAGGLIMWVPACIIYLTNILITIYRWFRIQSPAELTDRKADLMENTN